MDQTESDRPLFSACAPCALSRRGFMSTTALMSMAALLGACGGSDDDAGNPAGPIPVSNTPPAGAARNGNAWTVNLADATDLTARGLLILIGAARPALLVRTGTDSFAAYDARCPHAGSVAFWQVSGEIARCTNHGSEFALASGAVRVGPATTALARLPITRTGSTLVIDAA
jgi:nitrite reductase/ring-hydroxylating ferredoxin subunit